MDHGLESIVPVSESTHVPVQSSAASLGPAGVPAAGHVVDWWQRQYHWHSPRGVLPAVMTRQPESRAFQAMTSAAANFAAASIGELIRPLSGRQLGLCSSSPANLGGFEVRWPLRRHFQLCLVARQAGMVPGPTIAQELDLSLDDIIDSTARDVAGGKAVRNMREGRQASRQKSRSPYSRPKQDSLRRQTDGRTYERGDRLRG